MAKKKRTTQSETERDARPVAILTSDWHLQTRAWAERHDLAGDSYHALEQIVTYAINHSLPIIAAGDLIDRKANPSEVIGKLRHELDRCQTHGVAVWFIQGQHDMQDPPWIQAIGQGGHWLHGRSVRLDNWSLRGLDFTSAGQLPQALEQVPEDTDILVMHQRCEEFMGVGETDLSFKQIPYAKLLVVGDYHKSKVVQTVGAQGQGLTVVSPGSTCMQANDEPTRKGFYVLHDDLTVKFRELKSRPAKVYPPIYLKGLLAEFEETFEKDLAHWQLYESDLPVQIRKPIVVVKYATDVTGAYDRLREIIGDRAHAFIGTIASQQEAEVQAEEQRTYEEVASAGLVGALQKRVPDQESPLYQGLERLLQAEKPTEELHKLRKEFLREA